MRSSRQSPRANRAITFGGTCDALEAILQGAFRQALTADLATSADLNHALTRLRDGLRRHRLSAGHEHVDLAGPIEAYEARTRQEGFNPIRDWDGKAGRFNADTIPVDVLNYLIEQRGSEPAETRIPAILIDYYVLHVLALLSLRVWDEGDANENLDRVNQLVALLQGPNGSGHRFVDDAETIMLVATSHYEPDDQAYDRLLEKVRTLSWSYRTRIALGHAAAMGCHLRFGFEATYGRDTAEMRKDNSADYPWLCFALATLMREYARLCERGIASLERERVVEALLNGLSADGGAFVGNSPESLRAHEAERSGFRDLFLTHRRDLLEAFERYRPSDRAYSPLAFFFNFSHNVLKGMVVDALLWGESRPLTFNQLLTALPHDEAEWAARRKMAETLMGYARARPDRIRGRPMPVIVYDPMAGRLAYAMTLRRLREAGPG